jgi:hypothetical protein
MLKSPVFGDITPHSTMKIIRRFGGTYRLCLKDRKVNQARNQYEAGSKQLSGFSGVGQGPHWWTVVNI